MRKINVVGVCAALVALTHASSVLAQPQAPPSEQAQLLAIVERVSDTVFILEPGGFDALLKDPTQLARHGRIVPKYVGGRIFGFTLVGVPKGSLWALLGLSNGDVIRAIDGLALEGPNSALQAYQRIRGSSFVVDISRAGTPMQLTYNLRGKPEAVAPPPLAPIVAPKTAAPAAPAAPAAYRGGGRLRAHVALDFGDTPGDVTGTLRVMTDSPVIWSEITGGPKAPMLGIDFGRGEIVIRVSPGETAPSVEIVTFQVDGGDIAVKVDPQSTIKFVPGRGLEGARLDLKLAVTAGTNASDAMRDLLSASDDMSMTCRGSVLAPRCRLNRPAP